MTFKKAVFNGEGENIFDKEKELQKATFNGEGITLEEAEKNRVAKEKADRGEVEKPEKSAPQETPRPVKRELIAQILEKCEKLGLEAPKKEWLSSSRTTWDNLNDYLQDEKNFKKVEPKGKNAVDEKVGDQKKAAIEKSEASKKEGDKFDDESKGEKTKTEDELDDERAAVIGKIIEIEGPPETVRQSELNGMPLEDLENTLEDLKEGRS